jgi:hypothetical protein
MKTRLVVIIILALGAAVIYYYLTNKNNESCSVNVIPVALPNDAKVVISKLLDFAESLKKQRAGRTVGISAQMESFLAEKGVLGKGDWALAYTYVLEGDYEKAMKEYKTSLSRNISDAEFQASVHLGLADVYYNLALLDMVNRDLYSQTGIGFLVFTPDSKTKVVLECAKKEFEVISSISPWLAAKQSTRLGQLNNYLSGGRNDTAVTEDQAQAMIWLMAIAKRQSRPQLMDVVRRNIDAFRWVMFLQQEPFIVDALVSDARKRRFAEIDKIGGDFGFQLKGIYNLACLSATWIPMWGSYQRLLSSESNNSSMRKMLEDTGSRILESLDLLDLDLPNGVKENLQMKNNDPQNCAELLLHVQKQLGTKYSPHYLRLFVLIHTENEAVTFSRNRETFDLLAPMIPRLILTLRDVAKDAGVDQGTQEEFSMLAQHSSDQSTPNRIVSAVDRIFSLILSSIKENRRGKLKGEN